MIDKLEFDKFFKGYYRQVKHFIYFKVYDEECAMDLAQETFIRFWENRNKVKVGAEVSYLFGIATNLSMNHRRHLKVVKDYEIENPLNSRYKETPHFIMEENEFNMELQDAIKALTENQRVVFLMNRIDKLTYVEIAERIGVSVKAVEKRVHGALKTLHTRLKRKV